MRGEEIFKPLRCVDNHHRNRELDPKGLRQHPVSLAIIHSANSKGLVQEISRLLKQLKLTKFNSAIVQTFPPAKKNNFFKYIRDEHPFAHTGCADRMLQLLHFCCLMLRSSNDILNPLYSSRRLPLNSMW